MRDRRYAAAQDSPCAWQIGDRVHEKEKRTGNISYLKSPISYLQSTKGPLHAGPLSLCYTMPWATMASATLTKPAMFAPTT